MDTIQREILDRARRGEWFGDAPTGDAGPGDDAPRVEATFLRTLLLGTYGDGQQPPLGVRLRGVVVEGCLDLRDCCGTGDSGLPPILLKDCLLPGLRDAAVGGSRGNGSGCDAATTVDAADSLCIAADHATLSRLSLQDCRCVRISLRDAQVLSELELVRVSAPGAYDECQLYAPGVHVNGSILVCGTQLQVRDDRHTAVFGNIWQYACHLSDAEINGDLILQPDFGTSGGLSIAGARIHGSIWAAGARFDASGFTTRDPVATTPSQDMRLAFRAQRSKCNGAIVLSQAILAGHIDFLATDVGWLEMAGILATANITINASNARIATNFEISLFPQDARVTLVLKNSWIGDDVAIRNVPGHIDISLAHVGGDLRLTLGDISALRASLDASGIEVMGKVHVGGMVIPDASQPHGFDRNRPQLCFNGARIHGSFAATGLTILSDQTTAPTLSLDDAVIGRVFEAKGVNALDTLSLDSEGGHFKVEAWRSRNLPFYGADWHLLEVLGSRGEHGRYVVSFLRRWDGSAITILDGGSHRIHTVNASVGLDLTSTAMAQDYLRVFCDHVWGDKGAFHIETIRSSEDAGDDHWLFQTDMHYGGEAFETTMRVHRNGRVEMLEDRVKGNKAPKFCFEPPYRLPTPQVDDPFWIGVDQTVFDKGEVLATMRGRVGPTGKARVSMRGVRVGVIDHARDSFGKGVALAMEGLEYSSLRFSGQEMKSASKRNGHNALAYYREVFLDRQFSDGKPNLEEYKPQPYEQLSRVLRNHGELENARDVALEKLRLDRKLVYKWYTQLWHLFMEVGFKHGLSASRGTATFLLVLALGAVLFNALNHGVIAVPLGPLRTAGIPVLADPVDYPRMVVDAIPVSPLVLDNGGAARELAPDPRNAYGETWCGEQMDPVWYALDVMVPLLDLKHQDKCDVSGRDDAWGWRFLKALYALVGAAVTSIYLLAISGVLKRRVET